MRQSTKIARKIGVIEKAYRRQLLIATFTRENYDYWLCDMYKKELKKLNRRYYEAIMRE